EHEAIEERPDDRHLGRGALDVARIREPDARLEPLEARPAVRVERDDLAVDQEAVDGQRAQRGDDLRIAPGHVLAAASQELDGPAVAGCEDANAVVLDLEEPALPREGLLGEAPEHEPPLA